MSGAISADGQSPVGAYVLDTQNETRYADAAAQSNAGAANLIAYFESHAHSIATPQQLLSDYRALSVVLGAFDLGNEVNSPALVRQLLTQNPNSSTSLAARSGNAKFIAFAKAFAGWHPPPFSTPGGIAKIVNAYKTNLFESTAGSQTPGLQNALYFTREAASVTSVTALQTDQSLLAVAVTAAGLPLSAFDNLSFDQQTALLKQKVHIADFQKPATVQQDAELYLVQQQLANPHAVPQAQPGSIASLFASTAGTASANGVLTILEASTGGTASSLLGTGTAAPASVLSLFA